MINVNNLLVKFVQGFGDNIEPDTSAVEEVDSTMELKRSKPETCSELSCGVSIKTLSVLKASFQVF